MGNVLPTSAAQQEVDELRRKVIDLFSGQQFLLVGHYGVGKSSFINSVNHVFNVIRDPKFPYQEVAEIFQRETDHGSLVYTTYRPDTTGMYKGLETKELLAKREHAPVFFDVAGINDKIANEIDFKQLLIYLVNGQVKEYTQMIKIYKREEQMDYLAKIPKMDTLRAWSILCVVSLCDAFPQKFLEQVNEAVRQLQVDQGGARVFVILSKSDLLNAENRERTIEDYKRRCGGVLGIVEKRMFVVDNYSTKLWKEDATMAKDLQREKQVLIALNQILQPAANPRRLNSPKSTTTERPS